MTPLRLPNSNGCLLMYRCGVLAAAASALVSTTGAAPPAANRREAVATTHVAGRVTPASMRALAGQIALGDPAAYGRLEEIANELYRDINFETERERVMSNLVLMNAAFDELGAKAGAGNQHAMEALKNATTSPRLRGGAAYALGTAAAAGNKEALDMLLNFEQNGILLSSAVGALEKCGNKNEPRAVALLVSVLNDPKAKPLWHMASQGLVGAARAGNPEAKAALAAYRDQERPAGNRPAR